MRAILLIFILACMAGNGYSQGISAEDEIDTLISFFGKEPVHLSGYYNRSIPYRSKTPLYVSITYKGSRAVNYEYFRMDTSLYLVHEYYKDTDVFGDARLKSYGLKAVKDSIIGKSTAVTPYDPNDPYLTKNHISYYKALTKEGKWVENEGFAEYSPCWTGNYSNNKRTGVWKRIIDHSPTDFILEEIDYGKDSTKKIYTSNMIRQLPVNLLKERIKGRWELLGCDEEAGTRMAFSKCEKYDGIAYGSFCNEEYQAIHCYDLAASSAFTRFTSESCGKYEEKCKQGRWQVYEKDGEKFIEVKFATGQVWKYIILYIDNEGRMVTERL